jgi:hypothetical protein
MGGGRMNFDALKERLSPVAFLYIKGSLVIAAAVVFIFITHGSASQKQRLSSLNKNELARFDTLKDEYFRERALAEPLEKRLYLPAEDASPFTIIERIGERLGIKDKIVTFKPVEVPERSEYVQSAVEVKIDGLSLNELVNFIYRIENHRNLLLVKDFTMSARFEKPELLDIKVQVVLITAGAREG